MKKDEAPPPSCDICKKLDALELRSEAAPDPAYDICKQLDALEDISRLRPYNFSLTNVALHELESKVQDSFTLSDLIKFAEDAQGYVMQKWGDLGLQVVSSTKLWPGVILFHKQLDWSWNRLDASIQERLAKGDSIADIINDIESELEACNRKRCRAPAQFSF